ncbi:ASKHA domain-containing protein [Candidatus Formimonas warabiya]|uniref:Ferredoxin n=1 Tax=Formimonas warabiya TaxID=1761012 RepID=A0A3G1KZ78_FORW1|nr:ASKHA domain-containing protein [Candidatus Formimonas warabiya]ATW27802.1 ferredoxin [Candidatus Formimonas warabiya]
MYKITVLPEGPEILSQPGKNLMEILRGAGVFVDNPCNGKGMCGKCKIKHLKGSLPPVSPGEDSFLSDEEKHRGVRLSCLVEPRSDLTIELVQKEKKHEVLTTGYLPEFKVQPAIWKKTFSLAPPTLENQMPYEDIFVQATRGDYDWRLLQHLPSGPGTCTAVYSGNRLIGIEKGDTTDQLYGLAVDIGTTTVVIALIDLVSGRELGTEAMINAQKNYGLDVLTRVTYAQEHPEEGRKQLQAAIVDSLNEMMEMLCTRYQVDPDKIYEITVAANCTMLHLLLRVDAVSLGKSPYAPIFTRSKDLPAGDIGLKASPGARLYCLPSVSAYIGADIVAGAYVAELSKQKGNVLFIDIGTNGEIVLSHQGRLLSCSCAAGPALEGMNISAGMRAAHGAIEDVKITPSGIELKVIGDEEPVGLCGSGILAVVRELLLHGFMRKEGALIKRETLPAEDYRHNLLVAEGNKRSVLLSGTPPIAITQGDVRQVQLAKGAILSGFYALLSKAGITMDELDKVIIAGQFGAHLPAESLIGTGILPRGLEEKIIYIGNSSKTGAYIALMSVEAREEMEHLAREMDYMELSASEGYERLFVDCLAFPVK